MAGSTTTRVYQWLYSRLAGDSALQVLPVAVAGIVAPLGNPMRLYPRQAPEAVPAYPVLVMQTQVAVDNWGLQCHLPAPLTFTLHGIVPGPSELPLAGILDRVDALLTGDLAAVSSGLVLWGRRSEERDYAETTTGGKLWTHKLALYKFSVVPP